MCVCIYIYPSSGVCLLQKLQTTGPSFLANFVSISLKNETKKLRHVVERR